MVSPSAKDPQGFRVMLGLGAFVYMAWWFAVEWSLPGSFNPLPGRLVVVAYFLTMFVLTFVSRAVMQRAEILLYVGALILIGHYFYLFDHNTRDFNWTVGTYVTVFALCVGVQSRAWLLAFTAFCFACGVVVWLRDEALRRTIFLPGLATILALCLTMLLSRLRLLESLAESTSRFQSLFDATFEGVAVHDHGKIVDVNAAFASMFGYTREELIGTSVMDLTAPVDRDQVGQHMQATDSERYELVGLRRDGSEFAIEISSKPHIYQGRLLRLGAVRDISQRRQVEHERLKLTQEQAARSAAQEAIRVREEFISIASHELRTPITSLLLQLDVFVRRARAAPQASDIDAYAVRARRQLGRMHRLVEELLDVSRLGAGRLTLSKVSVDLDTLVRDVVDALSEDLRRAHCTVVVRSPGSLPGHWDRLRLEQVVENLVRNAMIYGAGKPIEVMLHGEGTGRVVFAIRDHGMGIDKSMQERVFKRFERAVSADHYGGLGLGLYIAKEIVEAHEGTLRVESELGKGATFWVDLPVRCQEPSSADVA